MKPTDVTSFINDLDGGAFASKVSRALSQVAAHTLDFADGKEGQVQITLNFKRISNSNQLEVKHKLSFKHHTQNGTLSEEDTLTTPMYATQQGLTLFQQDAKQFNFNKELSNG